MKPPVYVCLVAAALLASCGGGHRNVADESVQNPYVKQAKTLTDAGVSAMRRERWDYARNMFKRALRAAQLTDNPRLVAKEWYYLGAAHAALGQHQKALHDFNEAQAIAEQANSPVTAIRARLAHALLPGQGETWQPDVLVAKYPADVHLAAARLAQKQKRRDVAKQEYKIVLKKAGKSRLGVLYQAQAHLGLAMLARDEPNMESAKREVVEALGLLRQVGSPRLIAHALLFYGNLEISTSDRRQLLQRSLVIYHALEDVRGQRACLIALAKIEHHVGDTKSAKAYQQRLEGLQGRR